MTDREITDMMRAGDERWLAAVNEKYRVQGVGLAARICRSRSDGEEVFSDALMAMWNSCGNNPPDDVHAYLCRVIRNLSLKKLEYNGAAKRGGLEPAVELSEEPAQEGDDPASAAEVSEAARLINRYLYSCRGDARKIFVCRCYYGMSTADTAKHLKISESKVKSALMRVRKGLKEYLERNWSL